MSGLIYGSLRRSRNGSDARTGQKCAKNGEDLKAQIAERWMLIRTASKLPVILTLRLLNREIIDASEPHPHQPVVVEFPILVAIRPKPIS